MTAIDTARIISLSLRCVALAGILSLCWLAGSVLSGMARPPAEEGQAAASSAGATHERSTVSAAESVGALAVASLLQAAVFAYILSRSRWRGWKLVAAVFVAYFGVGTVVAQIDSIVFLPRHLPPGLIPKLFLMGAIVAGLFSPLAVVVFGKMKRGTMPAQPAAGVALRLSEWAWKLAAVAAVYVALYFTFGYFLAWKYPVIQAYYGGTDAGNFFAQIATIWGTTPWIFPLQAFRGLLWALFALPLITSLSGSRWQVALGVALLFSVWSSLLLLPNPYMPPGVRQIHLVETALEDLIFGWVVGWLFSYRVAARGPAAIG